MRGRSGLFDHLEGRALLARLEIVTPVDLFVQAQAASKERAFQVDDRLGWSELDDGQASGWKTLLMGDIHPDDPRLNTYVTTGNFRRHSILSENYLELEMFTSAFDLGSRQNPLTIYSLADGLDGTLTVKVAPEAGEAEGDPVRVGFYADLFSPNGPPDQFAGQSYDFRAYYIRDGVGVDVAREYTGHAQPASGYITIDAKVGDTFQVGMNLTASGVVDHGGGSGIAYWRYLRMRVSSLRPDLEARSLAWDPQGGVRFSYDVWSRDLHRDSEVKFFWVAGDRLVELPELRLKIGAGTSLAEEGRHTLARPDITTMPPAGTSKLRMVLDDGRAINESDEQNNVVDLAFDPRFVVDAVYDGDPAPDVIGRFFTGPVVTGQSVSFTLPASLRALKPTSVVATLGPRTITAAPIGGGAYRTGEFDPGALQADTDLVVEVRKDGGVLHAERVKVDVEKEPEWIRKALRLDSNRYGFDPGKRQYTWGGKLLDFRTGDLGGVALPASLWFGGGAKSGLDARADLTIKTGLNRTKAPEVVATLDVELKYLNDPVYSKSFVSSDQGGPFQARMDLDPGTLEIKGATFAYSEKGARSVDVLKDRTFTRSFYRMRSAVRAELAYDLGMSVSLGKDGSIAESEIKFDLDGALSGSLVDLEIASNSMALAILKKIESASPNAMLRELIVKALQEFGVLPKFDLRAEVAGALSLKGRAKLVSGQAAELGSFTGSIDLGLTGGVYMTWRGDTEKLVGLPEMINDTLKLKKAFP